MVDPDDDSLARSRMGSSVQVSRHQRFRSRGERIQVSSDDEVPHTVRASTALRDAGIASFISEPDPTQLDPSDCHSVMEQEQRGPDEVSAGAHSVGEIRGDVPSGRFAALASESGDESLVVNVCRAPSDVVHSVGVAMPATPVASAPKRLRLTSRNLHRMSQATTAPAVPESVCDALEFDLTRVDSVTRSIRPTLLSDRVCQRLDPRRHHQRSHQTIFLSRGVSMEISVPGDTEDTVSLLVETADVDPPRAPQLRAAFEAMDLLPECC